MFADVRQMIEIANERMLADKDADAHITALPALSDRQAAAALDIVEESATNKKNEVKVERARGNVLTPVLQSMLLLESGYDDSEQRKQRESHVLISSAPRITGLTVSLQAKAARERLRALNEERWKIMERQAKRGRGRSPSPSADRSGTEGAGAAQTLKT
eukprot:753792-Hanusia_phi.AAC.2